MKAIIAKSKDKAFQSFNLTLTVESLDEAKLLCCVFDDDFLGDRFGYNEFMGKELCRFGISEVIRAHLE